MGNWTIKTARGYQHALRCTLFTIAIIKILKLRHQQRTSFFQHLYLRALFVYNPRSIQSGEFVICLVKWVWKSLKLRSSTLECMNLYYSYCTAWRTSAKRFSLCVATWASCVHLANWRVERTNKTFTKCLNNNTIRFQLRLYF